MLALPESGIRTSIKKHNSDLDLFCDWVEASAVFSDDPISMSDVVDVLLENTIYEDQDFAEEFVSSAWAVIRARFQRLGNPMGLVVTNTRLSRSVDEKWTAEPAYAFCLYLACLSYLYPRALEELADANTQGELFEKMAVESLTATFPGWEVRRLGWSPDNPQKLINIVGTLTSDLREVPGAEVNTHVDNYSKELGLDVLLFRNYGDENASFPIIMMQCASGKNWIGKRKTPDLSIWRKIISFNSQPVKGMVIPYAFADDNSFRKESTTVEGIFLDRYRLLSPSGTTAWVSDELKEEIRNFLAPRVPVLPTSAVAA
ncbi:hypothetical protein LQE85_02565 [Stenotrophomonas rhizophila]|uniref:hypothetical protein n=1 Tax=Stenotrophomonas rhizophila TaxID=216778 RepID=UPI00201D0753|nr:hypothetical protein [Stenotrophomonas rhizophila]UQY88137.1 hypothetical protein LQE85_02565 [Stenotrophomonas rhizophila]